MRRDLQNLSGATPKYVFVYGVENGLPYAYDLREPLQDCDNINDNGNSTTSLPTTINNTIVAGEIFHSNKYLLYNISIHTLKLYKFSFTYRLLNTIL